MFTSIEQVNEQFFRRFFNLKIKKNGHNVAVPLRYARVSAEDYSEESAQVYPCIVIQDHAPIQKDGWYVDSREYIGGVSMDGTTVEIVKKPLWYEFMYDVSIAAKSYSDIMALKAIFLNTFERDISFLFNKRLEGENAVGDVVPYTVRVNDIPRVDGVIETNYEFKLSVWLYSDDIKEVQTIDIINVELHRKR